MRYSRWLVASFGFVVVSASHSFVFATYSIAATDAATQQVGGAVTSCVGSLDLASVYGSVPGAGVVHAQAQLDTRLRGKNRAVQLIEQGVAPAEIVAMITASSLDSGFAARQYGIVDLQGRAAGFTGAQAQAYKKDQQARSGSFAYSVQGNILTSQRVLDQAAAGFEANACDLAERLMAALEAGGRNGEGDSRCTSAGIPSDAAFIQVDLPGQPAGSWLKLSVSDTAPEDPLPKLRAMFDTWRKSHPCMASVGNAGSGGAATGGAGGAAMGGAPAAGAGGAGQSGVTAGSAAAAAGSAAGLAGSSGSSAGAGAGNSGSIAGVGSRAGVAGNTGSAGLRGSGVGGAGGRVGSTESSVGTAGARAGTTGQNTSSIGPTCAGSGPAAAGSCAAQSAAATRSNGSCAAAGVGLARSETSGTEPIGVGFGAALVLGLFGLRARLRRVPRR